MYIINTSLQVKKLQITDRFSTFLFVAQLIVQKKRFYVAIGQLMPLRSGINDLCSRLCGDSKLGEVGRPYWSKFLS